MKHLLSFLLFLCLTASVVSGAAADEPSPSIEYDRYGDFLFTVEAESTDHPYAVIYGYTGGAEELTVPSEIGGIPVRIILSLEGGECPERLVIPASVRVVRRLFDEADIFRLREIDMTGSRALFCVLALKGCRDLSVRVPMGDLVAADSLSIPEGVRILVERNSRLGKMEYNAIRRNGDLAGVEIIPTFSPGDLDSDGLCTTTDARLILQLALSDAAVIDEADVDKDGYVTTTDARLTLQYAVGKEDNVGISLPNNEDGLPFFMPGEVFGVDVYEAEYFFGEDHLQVTVDKSVRDKEDVARLVDIVNRQISSPMELPTDFQKLPNVNEKQFESVRTFYTVFGEVKLTVHWGQHELVVCGDRYLRG